MIPKQIQKLLLSQNEINILQLIHSNDGIIPVDIAKALNLSLRKTCYYITKLKKLKLVISENSLKDMRKSFYYCQHQTFSFCYLSINIQIDKIIFLLLSSNKPMSRPQIAKKSGLPPTNIFHALTRLESDNIVSHSDVKTANGAGRYTRYWQINTSNINMRNNNVNNNYSTESTGICKIQKHRIHLKASLQE